MSYTDKCCGVCDQYQDLYPTNQFHFNDHYRETIQQFKRFKIANVCNKCIKDKRLNSVSIDDLTLHKDMKPNFYLDFLKKYTVFKDPDTGEFWRFYHDRYDDDEVQRMLGFMPKRQKPHPRFLHVNGKGIEHDGIFSHGGIYERDKRKLRKALRLLGVKGKIERLIK